MVPRVFVKLQRPVGSMSGCAVEKYLRGRHTKDQNWNDVNKMTSSSWNRCNERGGLCCRHKYYGAARKENIGRLFHAYFLFPSRSSIAHAHEISSLLVHEIFALSCKNNILAYKLFFGRIHFTYFYCLRMHQDSWSCSLFWLQFFIFRGCKICWIEIVVAAFVELLFKRKISFAINSNFTMHNFLLTFQHQKWVLVALVCQC